MAIYTALFISAFLSATLLPGSSEVALASAFSLSDHSAAGLIATATAGNTLGSCVNWLIGRLSVKLTAKLDRFAAFYNRFGVWSLLLSWAPVIGDPLTVLAGLARTPLAIFIPLVMTGKLARYLVIAGLVGW